MWFVVEATLDAVNELGQVLAQLCQQWGSSNSSNNSNSNSRDAVVLHRKPSLTTVLVGEELEV